MYVRRDDINLKGHMLSRYLAVQPGQGESRPCHDSNVSMNIQAGRQAVALPTAHEDHLQASSVRSSGHSILLQACFFQRHADMM